MMLPMSRRKSGPKIENEGLIVFRVARLGRGASCIALQWDIVHKSAFDGDILSNRKIRL